ncbi:hypothetical protein AVEN_146548-1 [Araneus ventricosus]|uniref:Uncharacterized protein n=1 Tax=Araneus ventricosus TaxID=182803 RepID=A0A4Y2UA05_ARAVE|nr:hypothetical protein AVEN_146548-1 [Araneus ventricosus]
MSRSYLKKFQRLCCSDVLQWSRDIFVEHVTGHRQFVDPSSTSNRRATNVANPSVPVVTSNFDVNSSLVPVAGTSRSTYAAITAN